jgi:hypothetical protein
MWMYRTVEHLIVFLVLLFLTRTGQGFCRGAMLFLQGACRAVAHVVYRACGGTHSTALCTASVNSGLFQALPRKHGGTRGGFQ